VLHVTSDGTLTRFTTTQGLSHESVNTLVTDRAGNLWAGTAAGLSRLQKNGFVNPPRDSDVNADRVWSVFEDREGDLWIGTNSSLIRLRDDRFLTYGTPEGMPSDEPTVIRQDRRGTVWVGYHDRGLLQINGEKHRLYTTTDGLPSGEIFNVREARNGDLLISTRNGFSRLHEGRFSSSAIPGLRGRNSVYDAIEDKSGGIAVATSDGIYRLEAGAWKPVAHQKGGVNGIVAALAETKDGKLWVAMFNKGLRLLDGGASAPGSIRRYTTADGLGSNEIRSLYQEPDGTLWVGTFGSGLNVLRNQVFRRYDSRHGMLSDNISHVEDDGRGNLWLSTTRGISEISKQQLRDFDQGRIAVLKPRNFGVQDGLRSAQCAPGFPTAGGGTRTSDGHLWFATARGLASLDPGKVPPVTPDHSAPLTKILEISADGMLLDPLQASRLKAGTRRVQFRYTSVYLSAPERVRYATKLESLDADWVPAGSRRVIMFNPLGPGEYRFMVRAALPEGAGSESEFAFRIEPHFYQTWWFLVAALICASVSIYGFLRFRLRQVNSRFALVLEERTRLAREIHDTLAQNFLAIASQLDTTAKQLTGDPEGARRHLRLARRMTRHSFTEARRAVTDLRSSDFSGKDLPAALSSAAHRWVAGSKVLVQVETSGQQLQVAPDFAQNVLRIAQEAVTNTMKHADASTIWLALDSKDDVLRLRVRDDGNGFQAPQVFDLAGGHFGILGMGERAQRLGGQFRIDSHPGAGTEIEVTVPLHSE
jgi:ligand-binding sensor domain-containing protein/anti-sigma regulatory factor (Ser/Thr protein kinase)